MAICPTCHQQILNDCLGVRMSPFKVRIVDMIKAAGTFGIPLIEIHNDLYRGYFRERSPITTRIHIGQINDLLLATDWRLVADPPGRYARWHLRRVTVREAAE